jgi:N-acetylmuramoyl-L-alanine amidase
MIYPKQQLVPSNKYSLKCPNAMNAEYITFHNTANDASAQSEINYMVGNNNATSYHFAVDDKEVIQGIPLNRNAWHCGDGNGTGNRNSIGVEVCYSKSGGERYKRAEELAIKFIAQLLKERNWGVDRVKPHKHWSGKNCPHKVLDEGRWQSVLDRIAAELIALNTTASVAEQKVNQPKEDKIDMSAKFEPSISALNKSVQKVLLQFEQDKENPISSQWRESFERREMSISDCLALLYVAIERNYIK